jgi:succinate dehydrogenase hydrophobic anchor subunit
MDWLFGRATIVTLAVLGGFFAVLAWLLQARGTVAPARVKALNAVAYICMAASMVLFIVAGFWHKAS